MDPSSQKGFKLELFLSAIALGDLDLFSKSDPFVKVYFGMTNNKWNFIGKTETIPNDLNPNWSTSFTLNYIFEMKQDIKFQVCDDDGNGDELIGTIQTTLGALAGAKCQTSFLNLTKGDKGMGKLVVRCEKNQDCNQFLLMKWKAIKVMNTDSVFDWWNKSDPYLKFLKVRQDNSTVLASQTQVVANNLSPSWNPIEIPVSRLAAGKQHKFKIQCWDRQPEGKSHQFIGEMFVSAAELQAGKQYKLSNPKHNNPGTLVLQSFVINYKPTFVDYLRSGLQINLIVAIDFTGSNGEPQDAISLHYISNSLNQYQMALRSIGQILLSYDTDKSIPCFGFGAKPQYPQLKEAAVNHCFPLSGDYNNVNATSMNHLQNMYMNTLKHTQFAGPTYFHPLMSKAFNIASQCKNGGSNVYQVLLILTDGQIHDMEKTIDLICNSVNLPISIIIVGVGDADFSGMRKLDGDQGLTNSYGVRASRDIVQFVPFRQMNNNPTRLAAQLLAELPGQVVQYMTLAGIKPGPALNLDLKRLLQSAQKKSAQEIQKMIEQGAGLDKYMQKGNNPMAGLVADGANKSINSKP